MCCGARARRIIETGECCPAIQAEIRMLKTRLPALAVSAFLSVAGAVHAQDTLVLTVESDKAGPKISRQIFGQFAEHLGRGIYEGVWVGPNSNIPNTRGIRNDVVAA